MPLPHSAQIWASVGFEADSALRSFTLMAIDMGPKSRPR